MFCRYSVVMLSNFMAFVCRGGARQNPPQPTFFKISEKKESDTGLNNK